MYKKGDIIIHTYDCHKAIAVVLDNQTTLGRWISTEFIGHVGAVRNRRNTCNKYIFKPNQQYNIPEEHIITTIGFMDIEGKIITGPEELDDEDQDDWYDTEEEDD